jgi:hypothetical protein
MHAALPVARPTRALSEGSVDGRSLNIQGRGIRVLVVENGQLRIIHSHLSRFPNP